MAGEGMTARAVFEADSAPFQRAAKNAERSMVAMQGTSTNVAGSIRTAMAFTKGFGLVMAVRQAQNVWNSFVAEMEDTARSPRARAAARRRRGFVDRPRRRAGRRRTRSA